MQKSLLLENHDNLIFKIGVILACRLNKLFIEDRPEKSSKELDPTNKLIFSCKKLVVRMYSARILFHNHDCKLLQISNGKIIDDHLSVQITRYCKPFN